MPSKNPATGKALSGGAKRAAAKARKKSYVASTAAAAAANLPSPGASDFATLTAPPVGNSAEAVAWVNDAMLIALGQVLRDPGLDNLSRWRWIKEFGQALGHIRDKSAEQHRIRKLAEQMGTASASGSAPVGAKSLAAVKKPPTARRA